jgi:citrate lyase beta subunit
MKLSLGAEKIRAIRKPLTRANARFTKDYPGASSARQPIHTVYGGAQIFAHDTARKLGETALRTLSGHAPNARALSDALGYSPGKEDGPLWERVYARMIEKIRAEPVEDFRIDFEDGYGVRPGAEEDGHAESTALELVRGMKEHTLPPFIGIRVKPFNEENIVRSLRTLDIFVTTVLKNSGGKLPSGFVITIPKVTHVEQCTALEKALTALESKNKLRKGSLKLELMVEMPQSVLGQDGRSPLRAFVDACKGRCTGAHFGTYDYTAGCSITAAHQSMANPVCDFAKHVMQVSLAGTPVFLSDGATNVMPVGETATVHRAWRLSYRHIRHSLETGFYQGWDLHPAQLPIRYAATYFFFLESLESASARLQGFVEKAAKATLLGEVFDDAATGQGLLNYFLRGISCGAISENEALATGLTLEELRSRSFAAILKKRGVVS